MKNNHLRWLYLSFIVLLIVLQGVFINYWYEKTLDDIGFNAINISKAVANSIDIKQYEELLTQRKKTDYFYQMQNFFQRVQQKTGVKYIYVEHKLSDTEIEYIFDAEKDSFGEKDENSTPNAHISKNSFSTRLQTYSVWGTLISGFTPLINKEGKLVGAVGVDVDQSFFYKEFRSRIIKIFLYCITMILLFSILINRLQREITTRKQAQADLLNTTDALRNILNNTNQGFLTFGQDLLIDVEYSAKCEKFLGEEICYANFAKVIFQNDEHQATFLEKILKDILSEKDEVRRSIYLPLVPAEVIINNRHIELEYKIIKDSSEPSSTEKFMVILTDVTEKYLLQKQRDHEKKVLSMVVRAVVNRNDLLEYIKDYRYFYLHKFPDILNSNNSLHNILSELFIPVHTFKGGFSQLEMISVVDALHKFESQLSELKQEIDHMSALDLKQLLQGYDLAEWLDKDLNLLKNILGEDFLNQEPLIEESKLVLLEEKLRKVLSPEEYSIVLRETRKLRHKPFNTLLHSYPQYTLKLAERLEKQIYPFLIEGGDFPVDISHYRNFTKSLVHVFRNSIDHGLETTDERINSGKDEFGRITCAVNLIDNFITVNITDDGQGINIDTLKAKALEKIIYDEETINKLTNKEALELIFLEHLTVKEDVTKISGRGIGLSAVRRELDKLGGRVEITSKLGEGTEILFFLPLKEEL